MNVIKWSLGGLLLVLVLGFVSPASAQCVNAFGGSGYYGAGPYGYGTPLGSPFANGYHGAGYNPYLTAGAYPYGYANGYYDPYRAYRRHRRRQRRNALIGVGLGILAVTALSRR